VHIQTVVDRVSIVPALDPAALALFLAIFVAAALATGRRPVYGAALLAFVVPFDWQHAVLGTTMTVGKAVLAGALLAVVARPDVRARLRRREIATVLTAFAGVIVAIAASVAVALHRPAAVHEVLRWVEYALVFAAIAACYAADPDAVIMRRAILASAILVCCTAFVDEVAGAPFGIWIGSFAVPRISGALEGPNQLAGYLEIVLAVAGAWQLRQPTRLGAWTLVLTGVALPLTFSRGSDLGVIAIAVLFALVERSSLCRLAVAAYGLATGAAAVAFWVLLSHQALAAELFRASDFSSAAGAGLGSRRDLWRAAWFFFRHHPILGIGAGNYELELQSAGLSGVRTHANNWYLQALAEGGIVLFVATAGWIATVLTVALRAMRRSTWALAAAAAGIAMAVHGFVDYLVFFPKVAEAWIVLIALGAASGDEA
jgi:O-antigen ligase